jgi:hypothetical protein
MFVGTLVAIVAGHTLAENRVPAVDATQADATNPPVVTPFPTSEYPVESQDNVNPVRATAQIALEVLYTR